MRATAILLLAIIWSADTHGQTIKPSPYWTNQITFLDSTFSSFANEGTSKWVKFTILLEPYEPNVYFQDSRAYLFHYAFASKYLDPFLGMSVQQFNAVTLFQENQQAVLGSVIFPPATGSPPATEFAEYGIQFVRQDPFTREEIRDLFHLVRAHVTASPEVEAYYFPTYEQQAVATAHQDWLASEGVPLGSTARWAKGNVSYAQGWALGTLKFFAGDRIAESYDQGLLEPNDILLTDGVPAEVPFVAGILTLTPSTPNSHVAILARSYGVPFAHLALAGDAEYAQQLVGHRIVFSAYDDAYGTAQITLIDAGATLDDATTAQILQLKKPSALTIAPVTPYGAVGVSAEGLLPSDIRYVGGKASNFGILRTAIPDNSPKAVALSFDLWEAFLDQPLTPAPPLFLGPGEHMLFWADNQEERGATHMSFQLSRAGETIGLFDVDGSTLLDEVRFGAQTRDVSYGRSSDGSDTWQSFTSPTPGGANSHEPFRSSGRLVINEIMADNKETIQDPCDPGTYPDWIELYNGSPEAIRLDGMYLTDDVNNPTKWQIRPAVEAATLRQEIARRLSGHQAYPPRDMQTLAYDLAAVRSLFTNSQVTQFSPELREAVAAVLTDPDNGLDPNATLRFRSSTNVEDSMDFVGAGLYDSFSGCLADDLDGDEDGPCACDPNRQSERSAFTAIRRTLASFYNDNAFLERLRREVNESEVGMGMIVHSSFPDEIELANGVATLEYKGPGTTTVVTLVTQKGAISVTNPADGSTPEEVVVEILSSGYIKLNPRTLSPLKRPSSLVPLGRTVMDWTADYQSLVTLLLQVSNRFAAVTGKTTYLLDFEYKKMAPGGRVLPAGGLVIKQVRQMPSADGMQTPFLIDVAREYEVFTGEFEVNETADVFANHWLKSRWTLETRSVVLDANSLAEGLYRNVQIEYLDEDRIRTTTGAMALLPSANHRVDGNDTIDGWQLYDLDNPRTYQLRTTGIPQQVPATQSPLLTLADLGTFPALGMTVFLQASSLQGSSLKCLTLDVEYERPVLSCLGSESSSPLSRTQQNRVYLWGRAAPRDDDIFQQRALISNGISIQTSFYQPAPPPGLTDWVANVGATAPLRRWDRTLIEGLTTEPIVLTGYYSQTYRPTHHNFVEYFLFEPQLEPDLAQTLLTELRAQNIRFILLVVDHVPENGDQSQIATFGFDE